MHYAVQLAWRRLGGTPHAALTLLPVRRTLSISVKSIVTFNLCQDWKRAAVLTVQGRRTGGGGIWVQSNGMYDDTWQQVGS